LGQDLQASTVGIFGLGNIGQAIVKRLSNFEVGHFIYTGHSRKKAGVLSIRKNFYSFINFISKFHNLGDELGATFVSLNQLLEQSDFLVISASLNNETRGLFNDEAFDKMKKTAILVNISRGQIVNTESLVRALRNKKIFAAGLDVTDPEPLPSDHELLKLPNVGRYSDLFSSLIHLTL
jgi:glyoxylate/hydroxypyruvate reductase